MALVGVVQYVDYTRRTKRVGVKFTFSGAYVQVTGEAVNFANITNPKNLAGGYIGCVPDAADVGEIAGYDAEVTLGTTLANSKIQIFSTGGTELAAGAYPAAITGDANGVLVEFVIPIGKG